MNAYQRVDPWVGRSLGEGDRYKITRTLSSGGMGHVYLAIDTKLNNRQVAIKILKDDLAGIGEMLERFKREVDLCAALDSPNIVEISDRGTTAEGFPFYVMEYLQGQSLSQLLQEKQRLSVREALEIIFQVCDGLQVAHAGVMVGDELFKVVHRDLKPDNIFLQRIGQYWLVKILDFGIAKKMRQTPSDEPVYTNFFIGTWRYAAPEQIEVKPQIDQRADIYSLGMILYQLLSGTDPFGLSNGNVSSTLTNWWYAHISQSPCPLRQQPLCEALPAELEAIVMRCIAKVPDQRFASVAELKQFLAPLLLQEPAEQAAHELVAYEPVLPEPDSAFRSEQIPPEGIALARESAASLLAPTQSQPPPLVPPEVIPQSPPTIALPEPPQLPFDEPTAPTKLAGSGQLLTPASQPTNPEFTNPDGGTSPPASIPESAPGSTDDQAELPAPETLVEPLNGQIEAALNHQAVAEPNVEPLELEEPERIEPENPTLAYPLPQDTDYEADREIDQTGDVRKQPEKRGGFSSRWLILGAVLVTLGVAGLAAGIYFSTAPARTLAELEKLQLGGNYLQCLDLGETIRPDSPIYTQAQLHLNRCRLNQAKALYQAKKIAEAVNLANQVPPSSPLFKEAQQYILQWEGGI